MIPDSEITSCPEHEVESDKGTIFKNEKNLQENLSRFMKLILIIMSIIKKKYKPITVSTYYLELIFILLNVL